MNERRRTATWGVILVFVGVVALLGALGIGNITMQNLWPLLVMIGGVAMLVGGITKQPRDTGNIWFGAACLLCGGYFAYITLGPGEWADLRTTWPIFPLFGAVAWLIAWLFDTRQVSNIVAGVIAAAAAVIGYLYIAGRVGGGLVDSLATYWPLILVLLGVGLVVEFFVQRR